MPECAKARIARAGVRAFRLAGIALCAVPVVTSFVLSLVLYLREAGMRTALGAWFAGWSTGRLTLAAAAALAVAILAIGIGRHMLAEDHSTPHNEETNQRV